MRVLGKTHLRKTGRRDRIFLSHFSKSPASRLEKFRLMVQVAREATDNELRANIMNQKGGF